MFYQNPEYSEICPGNKEYVSGKTEGRKNTNRSDCFFVSLQELHLEFLKIGQPISFSKFCQICLMSFSYSGQFF